MEYLKFWFAKGITEILVILGIVGVIALGLCAFVGICVFRQWISEKMKNKKKK